MAQMYKVEYSEVVYYEEVVEADSSEDAFKAFRALMEEDDVEETEVEFNDISIEPLIKP